MAEMIKNDVEIMLNNVGMVYTASDGRDVQALTSVSMDIHKILNFLLKLLMNQNLNAMREH